MISVLKASANQVTISQTEALRYMGYGKQKADKAVLHLLDDCTQELENIVSYRCCYTKIPLLWQEDGLDIGFACVKSKSLQKNLCGCHEAFLFAATLGIEVDRLLTRYAQVQPAKGVVMDALASAAIESWCDLLTEQIGAGLALRSRFSAGYGDLSISWQKELLAFLDSNRKIGLSLTASHFMVPTKSVSAIIGIEGESKTAKEAGSRENRCSKCGKLECRYRRM